jgi:hypothetical protein
MDPWIEEVQVARTRQQKVRSFILLTETRWNGEQNRCIALRAHSKMLNLAKYDLIAALKINLQCLQKKFKTKNAEKCNRWTTRLRYSIDASAMIKIKGNVYKCTTSEELQALPLGTTALCSREKPPQKNPRTSRSYEPIKVLNSEKPGSESKGGDSRDNANHTNAPRSDRTRWLISHWSGWRSSPRNAHRDRGSIGDAGRGTAGECLLLRRGRDPWTGGVRSWPAEGGEGRGRRRGPAATCTYKMGARRAVRAAQKMFGKRVFIINRKRLAFWIFS